MKYAGLWRRMTAAFIDMIVFTPPYILFVVFTPGPGWSGDMFFMLIAIPVYAYLFSGDHQGTPGMRAMGVRVVTTAGEPVSFGRALWWAFTGTIGWIIIAAGLIYMQYKFNFDDLNKLLLTGNFDALSDPNFAAKMADQAQEFMTWAVPSLLLFFGASTVWAISIGASREKAGFHNVLCGTRFILKDKEKTGD